MFLKLRWNFVLVCFLYLVSGCAGQLRYSDGDIAGAVVGSILCTLIACCLVAFLFYWFYIRPRDGKLRFEDATKPGYRVDTSTSAAAAHTPARSLERENETIVPAKKRANRHGQSTYVNDGFHDNDLLVPSAHKSTHHYYANIGKGQKTAGGAAVRTQSALRRRASYGDKFKQREDPQYIKVKLRGHDFTGLGFNICGNLRDGIYVQNVLQKGPAADSGVLQPGDRIMDVRVSFKNIVFEDALTILSYASPYDVTLSIKQDDVSRPGNPSSDQTNRRSWQPQMDHTRSGGHDNRTYFPLKRSQSNGDLDDISRRSSSTASSELQQAVSPQRVRRDRNASAEVPPRRPAEDSHGYASINSVHRASPTSSIRHILTTPSVSGRDVQRRRDSPPHRQQETTKETTEEIVIFSKAGSNLKKKPAPPVPPPPPPPPRIHPSHLVSNDNNDDEAFPPPPRPFSSSSDSSHSSVVGGGGRRSHRTDSNPEESRSVGASSMLTEIFQEFEQDRSQKKDEITRPASAIKHPREYQTFEMIWTEGSESETSSVYDKRSEKGIASRKDSGFPLTENTYTRPLYSAQSDHLYHDGSSVRSPQVVQTASGGTLLVLPINMGHSPVDSAATSFTSDDDSQRPPSGRQSRSSYVYGETTGKAIGDGKKSPTKLHGVASPNFR